MSEPAHDPFALCVSPDHFAEQLAVLRRFAEPIALSACRSASPRTRVAVTFDDGYRDNYTHGFAFARELQVPITICLIPGYIESGERFWWLESKRLVRNARVAEVTIEGRTYHLEQLEEQRALVQSIDTRLTHAKSVAEREAFLASTQRALAVPASVSGEEGELPLTWAQIREMEENGLIAFAAHSMYHPILGYLADPKEIQLEVVECRKVLEQHLGHPVHTFAYPFGKLRHIGDEGSRAVKEAGYRWALTTVEGINTSQTDPHLLLRLPGQETMHWLVMASELVGLLGNFSRLRKKLFLKPIGFRGKPMAESMPAYILKGDKSL